MDCRTGCGACCIAPSLSSPIPGMPYSKPAGVPCIHLTDDLKCAIYDDPLRPRACVAFKAEMEFCGNSREEALEILSSLEKSSC